MRTLNRNIVVLLTMLFASTAVVQAQTPTGGTNPPDDLPDTELYNTTEQDLRLEDAHKINETPQPVDSVIPVPPLTYEVLGRQVETSFEVEPISAAKLKVIETLEKLYPGYLRAGVGTQTTPLGELYYSSMRSNHGGWGVNYRHLSSNGGVRDAGYSAFSQNEFDLFGSSFFHQHALEAGFRWDRDVVHLYGYDPTVFEFSEDTTRQRFNYFGGYANWKSFYKNHEQIQHNITARYYNYSALDSARENNVLVTAALSRYYNREKYGLDVDVDINSFRPGTIFSDDPGVATLVNPSAEGSSIIRLNPSISTIMDNFRVKVGLGLHTNITHTATFHFYPMADFRYSLFDDILIPYVGVTGGVERNSLYTLSQENPFMLTNSELVNSRVDYDFYGGIRGTISSTTSFNLRASNKRVKNMPLFVNDTSYSVGNAFMIEYDTVSVTNLSAEVTYQRSEKLKLHLRGDYFAYSLQNNPYAWNMPNYEVTLSGTYDLFDKIIVKADIFVVGSRRALSLQPLLNVEPENGQYIVDLKGFVDANLGLEYRYTKRLSAFINFNNVAFQKYPRWYNYNVQGFNLLGGITWSF